MKVTVEQRGTKYYLLGDTYGIKDELKNAGCRWDKEAKAWWTPDPKVAANFEGEIVRDEQVAQQQMNERSSAICVGKVSYKGKTYFIIGEAAGGDRLRLTPLNCSIDFWAKLEDCQVLKTYESRSFNGKTVHQTVGSIRAFLQSESEKGTTDAGGYKPASVAASLSDTAGNSFTANQWGSHVCCCYCGDSVPRGKQWCFSCGKAGYQ